MKFGRWIPISKAFAGSLPKDRPFSKLEAAYSIQLDYDAGNSVTVSGYAALWGWSRGKVERFLNDLGVRIQYPESTSRRQNQNGQIMIQITSRSRAENRLIRLIDSRCLKEDASRSRAENEQKTSRSQSVTIDPDSNPKINKEYSFLLSDGTKFIVDSDFLRVLEASYPSVDIETALRAIKAWTFSNPKKRKTRAGAMRFVNNWMKNEATAKNVKKAYAGNGGADPGTGKGRAKAHSKYDGIDQAVIEF